MKTNIFLSLALAPALLLVAQQFPVETTPPPASPPDTGEATAQATMDAQSGQQIARFAVDRSTWNVVDLDHPEANLSTFNTDEQRWGRYKATLAFEFPEEYARQYPPTREEFERREAGIRLINQPPSLETVRTSLSEEERQVLDASIRAILNPAAAVTP